MLETVREGTLLFLYISISVYLSWYRHSCSVYCNKTAPGIVERKLSVCVSISSKGCAEGSLCFSGSAHVRIQDFKSQKARAGV